MVQRLFRELGWGRYLLLWGFSLAFGLSGRESSTLPLHILSVLNDQYYFIFAILPIILFLCAGVMEDDAETVILRYGSYGRYFMKKWQALTLLCGMAWLGQMGMLFLSGWGLPLTGGWGSENDVFCFLQQIFPKPRTALLYAAAYLLSGYCLIALLTLWLGHFLPRSSAVKMLAVLYILAVLWLKLPVLSQPPFCFLTFLNHWVLLLHNLTELWRFPLTITVTLLSAAGMLWSVHRQWQKKLTFVRKQTKGLAAYYRKMLFSQGNLLLLTGVILLLTAWAFLSGGPLKNGREWAVRLLAGHGVGYFHMMRFLSLIISEIIPLWPIGGLLSQTVSGKGAFQIIRLHHRKELLHTLLCVSFLWLGLWTVLLLGAEMIPPCLLAVPVDVKLAVSGAGLRFLDMGLQLLLLILFLCYTGQITAGFIGILALHFLCVLPVSWLPVGLSSLLRLSLPETNGSFPLTAAVIELAIGCAALLVCLVQHGVQRLFEKNGGLL